MSLLVRSDTAIIPGAKQMKRCDNLVDVGRRQFLSGAGAATAASTIRAQTAETSAARTSNAARGVFVRLA